MSMEKITWYKLILLSVAVFCSPYSLASLSAENQKNSQQTDNWQNWNQVGEAQLSILFFDIYQSKLTSPTGIYQQQSLDVTPHPLALSINYQRNITQKQLLDATYEQWVKLGYTERDAKAWITQLSAIFPNIKSGQTLTYITNGETGQFVYSPLPSKSRHIGTISDERLNDAFLSIWLSPKTEYADLRRQLIGMKR
ncbi:chalcone isomerase family protein [Vibrio fluminensis]|uniref:chalcone isomerase family protein n=1 Tax=Vibrio fluminensis TaxID=2783614 RepID=UPI001889B6B4|nr:chalcone isomerase family protein [Vibrio fluminensis]